MNCPQCNKPLTLVGRFCVCAEHGQFASTPTAPSTASQLTANPSQVFISYGRADAMEFSKTLATDLERRGGFRVFLDLESIEKGGLWEVRIEQGIRESAYLLAVLSPHAVREESVCRDEVVYALCAGKPIVPLRQDPSPQLRPPLLLARRNWIDFTGSYEQGFDALLRFLNGDESALQPPSLPTITGVVPLDFSVEIARFTHGFTGREWVHQEIDRWLATDDRRAMVIVAEPGIGKSAIAAWLSQSRSDVIGIHFCTQQNARTRDPHEFVACLVSHLHARLPGFAEAVEAKHPKIRRPDAKAAFRELIIEPARNLPALARPCLIVADSLDESLAQSGETVVDVLVDQVKDLPAWLRVIATTRPEQPILQRIRTLNVFELVAERPENHRDLQRYITTRLQTSKLRESASVNSTALEQRLLVLSEGNFLYARLALDALEEGSLTVAEMDALSPGLADYYSNAFSRKFPDLEVYAREISPLLTVLAVACGPLPFEVLCRVANGNRSVVNLRLNRLRSWLKIQGQGDSATYSLFHKSFQDWLGDRDKSGDYWCDPKDGHGRLVELLNTSWQADDYALRNLITHMVALERWDEACALLCNLRFVEARCLAGQVFELQADYQLAMAGLPEAQADLLERRIQAERAQRWTDEVIEYSRRWITGVERPPLPEIIPSVEPWGVERIEAECKRIIENPTRLDRLRAFAGFVESECYLLIEFGKQTGFVVQHSFNLMPGGSVHDAAAQAIGSARVPLLLRYWPSSARHNPKLVLQRTLKGHSAGVRSVSVTTDGRRAVSGSYDKTLRVWDLESGACLRTLEGHNDLVLCVNVTPDGQRAVSGGYDKTLRVWDLESGACLRTLEGHRDSIWSANVTPDGRRAVSGSYDNTLRVWDLESGACLRILEGHSAGVSSVSLTPDGLRAVSGSYDKTLRVWDLERGACLCTLEGHSDWVSSVSLTPDGRRAVSGSHDRTLRIWNLDCGECLRTLVGHNASVWSVNVTLDGQRAVSGSYDKTLRVWDLESGACLRMLEGHSAGVRSVNVTPDGRRAMSGSEDNTLRVWNLESGARLQAPESHSDMVLSVNVTPDGRRGVSGSSDKTLRVWDLESGACLRTLEGHSAGVRSVTVTPDGHRVVSGSVDNTLRVWDLESGACLRTLEGHGDWVSSVSVTPDGRRAVSGSSDKTLQIWDLESGACLRTLEGHSAGVRSVSVTPDGRCAVSGSSDNTLRVWDLKSGACLHTLEGHSAWVCGVNVTPDGRRAVSQSWDSTLRVWDLESGSCLRVLKGHSAGIGSVSVTPDGRRAVSGSEDNTFRVWDLESGNCVGVFPATAQLVATAIGRLGMAVAGTMTGEVVFLELRHFPAGVPILTAQRRLQSGTKRSLGYAARCPSCGKEFVPSGDIAATIESISLRHALAGDVDLFFRHEGMYESHPEPEPPVCFEFLNTAFDDPRLLSSCPHCAHALKFNPFFVEGVKGE